MPYKWLDKSFDRLGFIHRTWDEEIEIRISVVNVTSAAEGFELDKSYKIGCRVHDKRSIDNDEVIFATDCKDDISMYNAQHASDVPRHIQFVFYDHE